MGEDIQGIERGKCAYGECDDFMRSDGATCGYLPNRHSKKDACFLGVKPPPMAISQTTSSLELRLEDFLRKVTKVVSWESEAIREFSDQYIVPKNLWKSVLSTVPRLKCVKRKRKRRMKGANGTAEPGVQH